MKTIFIYQIFFLVVLLGWSAVASRRLVRSQSTHDHIENDALLGLIIAGAVALILNFFVAISWWISCAFSFIGVACFVREIRNSKPYRQALLRYLGIFVPWALVVAAFTCIRGINYDTGLYHLQTARWIQAEALPIGLANLYSHFGFNSFWLTLAPILSWPTKQPGLFVVNSFVLSAFLTKLSFQLFHNKGALSLFFAGIILNLLFISGPSFYFNDLRSLSTDIGANIFTISAWFIVIQIFQTIREQRQSPAVSDISYAVIFAVSAFLMKASQVSNLILAMFLCYLLFKHYRWPALKPLAIFMVTICSLWTLRTVLLTGCAIFPADVTCVDSFAWSVPKPDVIHAASWIESWAKRPGSSPSQVLGNYDWLIPWAKTQIAPFQISFVCMTLCGIFSYLFYKFVRKNLNTYHESFMIIPALSLIVGFMVWFLKGPDTRFASGYLIVIPSFIAALQLSAVLQEISAKWLSRTKWIFVVIPIAFLIQAVRKEFHVEPLRMSLSRLVDLPKTSIADVPVKGGIIFRAEGTDQCWDAKLLCTPYPKADLVIIKKFGRYAFLRDAKGDD